MSKTENKYTGSPFNTHLENLPHRGIFDMTKRMPDLTEFRKTGIYFMKYGHYPKYDPKHPERFDRREGSEDRKFWDEERRRCREGLTIGDVHVNKNLYAHLNYGILQATRPLTPEEVIKIRNGEKIGKVSRSTIIADPWDVTWHMSNYIEQAERDGQHAAITKGRGVGMSYYLATIATNCYFHEPGGTVFVLMPDEEALLRKDAIINRIWDQMDFIQSNTPFWKLREGARANRERSRRAKHKPKVNASMALQNVVPASIEGIITKGPNKFRGSRANYVILDEVGNQPAADSILSVTLRSMEQNNAVYGQLILAGTGGTAIKDLAAFTRIIGNPGVYNIMSMRNVFSKVDNGKKVPLFLGSYWNNQGYFDNLGRSDVNGAFQHELRERDKKAELSGKNSLALSQYKAENALYIEETISNVSSSRMPVEQLNRRLDELIGLPIIGEIGYYNMTDFENAYFVKDKSLEVFNDFPVTDGIARKGAVVRVHRPDSRLTYFGGIDPYSQDDSSTESHGGIYVMCRETDEIVAYYVGRPESTRMFAKICIALLRDYNNALALPENNVTSIISNFQMLGAMNLIALKPTLIQALLPKSKAKQDYGMHMVPKVYNETLNYIREWLLSTSLPDELANEDTQIKNVDNLPDAGIIRELLNEKEKLNFDRLKTWSMLFLYRQELKIIDELGLDVDEDFTEEIINQINHQINDYERD